MKRKGKRYFPLCLDLDGKKVFVIGGGKVAERKVIPLLECGANITVISPSITEKLRNLFKKGKLRYLPKAYKKGELKGAFLVISATGEKGINMEVSEEAESRGCLYNVVDNPEASNFIVPSSVKRGGLLISISTSGVSPALSKRIRKELEKRFGREYTVFLNMMEGIRRRLLKEIPSESTRRMIFYKLVNSGLTETIKEKGIKTARIKAKEIINQKKT